MMMLETLTAQQKEIREISSTLRAMLTPEQLRKPAIAKVAHILLCDLCRSVNRYLAQENDGLYPNLLAQSDLQLKNLAWGFIAGDKTLRQAFDEYSSRWLADCEFQFTWEFVEETSEILEFIEERIEREQMVIIPRLMENGYFPVAAA